MHLAPTQKFTKTNSLPPNTHTWVCMSGGKFCVRAKWISPTFRVFYENLINNASKPFTSKTKFHKSKGIHLCLIVDEPAK